MKRRTESDRRRDRDRPTRCSTSASTTTTAWKLFGGRREHVDDACDTALKADPGCNGSVPMLDADDASEVVDDRRSHQRWSTRAAGRCRRKATMPATSRGGAHIDIDALDAVAAEDVDGCCGLVIRHIDPCETCRARRDHARRAPRRHPSGLAGLRRGPCSRSRTRPCSRPGARARARARSSSAADAVHPDDASA